MRPKIEDPERSEGLHAKFHVERIDPESEKRHKGHDCFVLDLDCDRFAKAAILAYANACVGEYPFLARDLRARARRMRGPEEEE